MKGLFVFVSVVILGIFMFLIFSTPVPVLPATDRGDLWIQSALESVMEKDGRLDLTQVGVSCSDAIVKFSGTVLTDYEKGLAELLGTEIPGVKGIQNNILVMPVADQDVKIAKEVQTTLFENPLLHINHLRVHAQNGMVTLEGIVYHTEEERLANRLVARLPRVHGVINKLETLYQA